MRHLSKSGIVTLQALGGPIGSRTAQVQEQQLEETKFIAFFMGKKIDIEGKDLYDAKQKAITQLKVPKSKVGLLAVVSAESQKNQDFRFESVNEENPGLWANIRAKRERGEAPSPKNSKAYKDAVEAGKEINKEDIENVANGLPQTMGKQKSLKREALKSIVREVMQEEAEYQKFFQKVLDKAGKSIPSMSDDEKKAFFNKVDAAWKGKQEGK
jgi:translation elongation factor EF-G